MDKTDELIHNLAKVYIELLKYTDKESDVLDSLCTTIWFLRNTKEGLDRIRPYCHNCENFHRNNVCDDCGQRHVFTEWKLDPNIINYWLKK